MGMGILPLQFKAGESADTLGLKGFETFSINFDSDNLHVGQKTEVVASTG